MSTLGYRNLPPSENYSETLISGPPPRFLRMEEDRCQDEAAIAFSRHVRMPCDHPSGSRIIPLPTRPLMMEVESWDANGSSASVTSEGDMSSGLLTRRSPFGFSDARIGGHLARSMMLLELTSLVRSLPASATKTDIARAVVDDNILEKPTQTSRVKSLRHLTELYGLDSSLAVFRVLWELGHADLESLPQLCVVLAYARDPQLRQSFELIRTLRRGEVLERARMEVHLETGFPGRFSAPTKKSMAQNVNTSWTFAGHLYGKTRKARQLPQPRPVSAAYAMFVGYLTGLRGERLLDSAYAALVAPGRSQLLAALSLASAKGLLSLKSAAGIVEFDFSVLLTPEEQRLLHESN